MSRKRHLPFGLSPWDRRNRAGAAHWVPLDETEPRTYPPEPEGSFEEHWLAKYGEPISCQDLSIMCSRTRAEGWRLDVASVYSTYSDLATLIGEQWRARRAELDKPMPGGTVSFRERSREERRAFRALPGVRLVGVARVFQSELAEYERHTRDLLRRLRSHANPSRPRPPRPPGPEQDFALTRAAFEVSEWIRARHPRGPRFTCWPDVATCLEWYGWDLSSIAVDRGDALRRRVQRAIKTGGLRK